MIQARLAELRSDFVSTVTHNLKAPITSIRILGETLARRTDHADNGVRKYGMMLVQETWQLARLVDNLLAYSRVTDVTEIYSFEPVALDQLVEKALGSFGLTSPPTNSTSTWRSPTTCRTSAPTARRWAWC